MRLIIPIDSQEIDGDSSQHDGQADAAHHRLRVQREDEQESPEDKVNDRPYKADLEERKKPQLIIIVTHIEVVILTSLNMRQWYLKLLVKVPLIV